MRQPVSLLSLSQNIARINQVGRAEIPKYRQFALELSTTGDSDGKITYKRKRDDHRGCREDNAKIYEQIQTRDGDAHWTD